MRISDWSSDVCSSDLVWALEAIRTRRLTLGWSPDIIPGGAAASLETGVPQFMMSMLIRAGLPSRRAAIAAIQRSEEHTSELQSLMRISYAVFCLKKKKKKTTQSTTTH